MKISTDKKRVIISIILCIVLLMISIAGFKYGQKNTENKIGFGITIFLSIMISFMFMIKIKFEDKIAKWLNKVIVICSIFSAFIMSELLNSIKMFDIDTKLIALNLILICIIYLIVAIFFSKAKIIIIISNSIIFLLGFTNLLVTKFRGTPFVPWDILCIGTATEVAGNYSFAITPRVVLSMYILFFIITIAFKMKSLKTSMKKKVIMSLSCLTIAFSFLFVFFTSDIVVDSFGVNTNLWEPILEYKRNGIVVSFFKQARNLVIDKPNGYSEDKVNSILENVDVVEVSADIKETNEQLKPNIVVIMNESLADLRVIEDFEISEEIFPFMYSLKENTIRGNLHVSVFGGATPNTEWEFLTRQYNGIYAIFEYSLSTICI